MASTESTPLFQKSAAQGALHDVNQVVSSLFTRENLANAGTAAKDRFQTLQQQARHGDFSIRLLAFLSGISLVILAGLGFLGLVLQFQITQAVLELYTLLLGIIMLLLESRGLLRQHAASSQDSATAQQRLIDQVFKSIYKYALFLKFVWGRGGLYVVAGSLQLAQGGSLWSMGIGCFVMLVGVLYIIVGRVTARKLTLLRQSLSEQTLRSKFREADTDGNGSLSLDNFQVLCEQLGLNLSRREREVAFLCMDRNDVGTVSFEDLQAWWVDWDDEVV